jgi:hypothetical protein
MRQAKASVRPGARARAQVDKRRIEVDEQEQPECEAAGGAAPQRPTLERSGHVRASEMRVMVDDFIAWESAHSLHEGPREVPAAKPGATGIVPLGQLLPSAVRRSLARLVTARFCVAVRAH